jgi:hypothetical protein
MADQKQGWMGICHHEQRGWFSKWVKQGDLPIVQGVSLGGNALHHVNIAMNDL